MLDEKTRLDPDSLRRLRKVWNLYGRPGTGGEGSGAEAGALRIVSRFGHGIADVPRILAEADAAEAASKPFSYSEADLDEIRRRAREAEAARRAEQARKAAEEAAAHEARRAAREAEEARQHQLEYDAVIRKYGSAERVKARTAREEALVRAAHPFLIKLEVNGRIEMSLSGWNATRPLSECPADVIAAISAVGPMPRTIEAAKAAHDLWEERDHDLRVVFGDYDGCWPILPLGPALRWALVTQLLETGLRAQSIGEVLIRQRHGLDQGWRDDALDRAVMEDLEHLSGEEARPATPTNGPARTAGDRRKEIERLLRRRATAELSDREIARRSGVSPSTVGAMRARMTAKAA